MRVSNRDAPDAARPRPGDVPVESALLGPGLGAPGRGLALGASLLDGIESEIGDLTRGTKGDQLAKLDQVAQHKYVALDVEVDSHAAQQESGAGGSEPAHESGSGSHDDGPIQALTLKPRHKAPPSVAVAADRDGMRTQIVAAGEKEVGEIDAAFERQVADLDRRFEGQLGGLDAQIATTAASLDQQARTGDASVAKDIGHRDDGHQHEIGQEAAKHVAEVSVQQQPLADIALHGGNRATTSGTGDAAATRAHAQQQAATTRANGAREAAAARKSGADKWKQATDAAESRAHTLSGDEASGTRADGARRGQQAMSAGESQAHAIEVRAESAAQRIIADGERAAQAQIARGKGAGTAITTEQKKQGGRIQTQADVAKGEMQQHASNAHQRMEDEHTKLTADVAGAKDGMAGGAAAQRGAAGKKAADLRTDAVSKLRTTHDTQRAKVEAKTAKMLAGLDRAPDKDLARVGKQLGRDLYALDQTDSTVERAMKKQVKRSEGKLQTEVDSRKRKVRAEGATARAAIDQFVKEARKRIAKADQGTDKDIAGAAKRGLEQIRAVGGDAATQLQSAADTANSALGTDAAKDRLQLDKTTTDTNTELAKMTSGVKTTVDKQWVDDAVSEANHKLDDTGVFNVVTDGEATRAMNVLTSLPPELQGQAVNQLGNDQFHNLLTEVPAARREEFEPLVKATTDPDRKLALWGEFHRSEVSNDIARTKGDTGDGLWFYESKSKDQEEQARRNDARIHAGKTTDTEVADEMKFLRDQKAGGKPFTAGDVDALMVRKGAEHDTEMKYNTNLTNETGVRKDGSKIVWTKAELDELEASFGQIPESHMAGNKLLKEVRRGGMYSPGGTDSPNTGGTHSDGVVTAFDTGSGTAGSTGFRHAGDQRELASPYICGKCGVTIAVLDMVVTHEIGHDMHDQNKDAFDKFQSLSGWKNEDKTALTTNGLSAAEIQSLEDTRAKGYWERNTVTKNGKQYMVDPYGKGYLAVDETAIPAKGEAETGAGGTDTDTWAYARSNYKDHFAETYAKAVHTPEKLHKDLVERPAAATAQAKQGQTRAQQQLDALKATPGTTAVDIKNAQDKLDAATKSVTRAESAETARVGEFNVMRNDIFHGDIAQTEAETRLGAKGISPDKLTEFKARAAKASTPEQIATIEAEYK